ncbi:MAG: hypothetical protein P8179_22260 [Candidatus Thiodiazotropha sp.]
MLILANLTSICWYWVEGGFEPAITSILIFTAIIGIFVERWINNKARRSELLHALVHELYINSGVLASPEMNGADLEKTKIFTRLNTSMVDACLVSGCFMEDSDKKLFKLLHDWKAYSTQFNSRLTATESAIILNSTKENISLWNAKLSTGKTLKQIQERLTGLGSLLLDDYSKESGITDDTILFN